MDVANTSHIARYIPPTITRRPHADEPRPVAEPLQSEIAGKEPELPSARSAAPVNPLAALFGSGVSRNATPVKPNETDDDQPALGRFVDVIA